MARFPTSGPIIAEHPQRPRRIGIAGYPEGHPSISYESLQEALEVKSRFADYVATQMCFDTDALRGWVARQRERGMPRRVARGDRPHRRPEPDLPRHPAEAP